MIGSICLPNSVSPYSTRGGICRLTKIMKLLILNKKLWSKKLSDFHKGNVARLRNGFLCINNTTAAYRVVMAFYHCSSNV